MGNIYKNSPPGQAERLEHHRPLPVLFEHQEECCGCSACYAVCGEKGAIIMISDREGFLYPTIDESRCIRCWQCIQVCPFKEREVI